MPKVPTEIKSLARSHTETAINTLAGIMRQANAPHSARVAAATALLDRGWGKPEQSVEMTGEIANYVVRMPEPAKDMAEWTTTNTQQDQPVSDDKPLTQH